MGLVVPQKILWNIPGPGIELESPALAGIFLTIRPEKSLCIPFSLPLMFCSGTSTWVLVLALLLFAQRERLVFESSVYLTVPGIQQLLTKYLLSE